MADDRPKPPSRQGKLPICLSSGHAFPVIWLELVTGERATPSMPRAAVAALRSSAICPRTGLVEWRPSSRYGEASLRSLTERTNDRLWRVTAARDRAGRGGNAGSRGLAFPARACSVWRSSSSRARGPRRAASWRNDRRERQSHRYATAPPGDHKRGVSPRESISPPGTKQ